MRKKTRERLGIGVRIGAALLALVMIIAVVVQGFMYGF